MNKAESLDRNIIALAGALLLFLVFLLTYFFPRLSRLRATEKSVEALAGLRQEVSVVLPEVSRTAPTTPLPTPDVRTWVAANTFHGLEKNLAANDGYLQGEGAQIKLKRLTALQTARFLSSLTQVQLVVERMQLQDSDTDGHWDMEISLKVP